MHSSTWPVVLLLLIVSSCASDEREEEPPVESSGGEPGTQETAVAGAFGTQLVESQAHESFSFFVTSQFQLQELSGSADGFGGDLRFEGATSGLAGADAICQELARRAGHGEQSWRAFLSTTTRDAIDRIGEGPWFDYLGNLVARDIEGLAGNSRPGGGCCDVGTYDETGMMHDGIANGDDHDVLTGSDREGRYDSESSTCDDWTSTTAIGTPRVGHSWPRAGRSGKEWIMEHRAAGCGAGINTSGVNGKGGAIVGSGGGYGGFYCFAL